MNYANVAPIVTVIGPGNFHHISYDSISALPSFVGMIPTSSAGVTNFLLSFSFSYLSFAFYWDGDGPAFWREGNSSFELPVGTSWADAIGVPWSDEKILGLDVEAEVAAATTNDVPVYIIPEQP
ncbi:hypothetical protein B0H16DRAFT_1305250 [Mycena metata]|uniref:Uncharacterized protein n=1 Tax=Mycena metata TaxID=1033252 RepID=A0AAD7JV95_9AGAR|nr:hypothetical protein B0H16DRAFT_1305250 [Mycena metata]